MKSSLWITAALLFTPLLFAQEDDAVHTLNMQDTDIRLLVETISDITGKNFVIDPAVDAKITVISGNAIPSDEIYDLFLSILSVNGYSTEQQGNTIKIIPVEKVNPLQEASAEHPDQMVTKIYTIRHVDVGEVETMLKTVADRKAKILSNKDSNILIIADRAANVEKMERIIQTIDRRSDASIELIPIAHANAEEVAETLETLLNSNGGNGIGPKSRIVADQRTNSVIVNASPALKGKILDIIKQLDVPLDTNTASQVIYLKYAKAENLVPILETLANHDKKEGEEARATIQAHVETNALIINAPAAVYRNIQYAIDKLDIRRQQILIEAIIAEVTVDYARELGVQWQAPIAGDQDDGLVGGTLFGSNPNNIDPTSDNPLDIFGGLLTGGLNLGYLNFGTDRDGNRSFKFGALLSALGTNTNNNILSTPSVVTLNHQEANLSVGQEVPFVTGQFSNTGASGSDGAPNPFTTIQREEVGLSLTVTPHINEGDQIIVDIAQEVSSLDPTSGAVDLITNKKTLTTSVMIPDNTVLVLGGLIDDTMQETIRKVPVLGDIPLIKNLFRHKKRLRVKRNLMIFIHPRIIRDEVTQINLTNEKYDEIRQQQLNRVPEREFRDSEPLLPPRDRERD